MPSFYIKQGLENSLPNLLTEGTMYVCLDTGSIFVDAKLSPTSELTRIQLSGKTADKLNSGSVGALNVPVYFVDGEPVEATNSVPLVIYAPLPAQSDDSIIINNISVSSDDAIAAIKAKRPVYLTNISSSSTGGYWFPAVAFGPIGVTFAATWRYKNSDNVDTFINYKYVLNGNSLTCTNKVSEEYIFTDTLYDKLVGIESGANKYILPQATTTTLGGIKVGSGLSISNGVLSAAVTSLAWGNITGKPSTFTPASHTHNYAASTSAGGAATKVNATSLSDSTNTTYYVSCTAGTGSQSLRAHSKVYIKEDVLMGAAWNDYAEYRQTENTIEPGRVVCENGDDTLSLSKERLQKAPEVVSDTFGFAIGETSKAKTPIAVAGRVLVYTYEPRDSYEAGDVVCAAPGGTVSKMTREEIIQYPDRIIGIVSAIPNYEIWGSGNVNVNGRIWIKIK